MIGVILVFYIVIYCSCLSIWKYVFIFNSASRETLKHLLSILLMYTLLVHIYCDDQWYRKDVYFWVVNYIICTYIILFMKLFKFFTCEVNIFILSNVCEVARCKFLIWFFWLLTICECFVSDFVSWCFCWSCWRPFCSTVGPPGLPYRGRESSKVLIHLFILD